MLQLTGVSHARSSRAALRYVGCRGAARERLLGILLRIIATRYGTGHLLILGIVVVIDVSHVVAVVVMLHERMYILLIMTEMVRSMMAVVVREVIPVVRRTPVDVFRTAEAVEQRRTFVEHRLDDIVRTVDIRRTNHLNIRRGKSHLYNERGYVLINVRGQHGLDEQHVGAAFKGLKHTEIIDIPIVVEVEVGDDVRTGVQYLLKLLDAVRLRKSSSNGLQIEVQTDVLRQGRHLYSSGTRGARARVRSGGAHGLCINDLGRLGLSDHDCLRSSRLGHNNGFGCNGNDTCHTTACQQERQGEKDG